MDDKDWLILKAISEEKNITKAAERLYISQPALTYRVKNMEKEFGAKIVSRNPNGVILTHKGEFLLNYSIEMLNKLRDAKERVKNMENKVQGTLRLGSSAIFAHYELPKILKLFLEQYPDVEITLKTGLSAKVHRMLQKEEISRTLGAGATICGCPRLDVIRFLFPFFHCTPSWSFVILQGYKHFLWTSFRGARQEQSYPIFSSNSML